MRRRFDDYLGIPRSRKVKHVKFIARANLSVLEEDINSFADEHPEYKILGIKLTIEEHGQYISTITYLEDAKGIEYDDYEEEEIDE